MEGAPVLVTVEGDSLIPRGEGSVLDALDALPDATGRALPLDGAGFIEPLSPGTIFGIGLNYRAHAAETGAEPPPEPHVFVKLASSATRPSGPVVRPRYTDKLDYEGELAVVIGQRAKDVKAADALGVVAGYAVMNDVSARDRQRSEPRWIRAKGGDTFAPFGPWVTSADEVPDPQALRIRTWVNDELRQDGSTADMVFSVAELIEYCSHSFTLRPGDVIATGTPAGVGVGFDPPRFLDPGDRVRIAIDGLGEIEHGVVEP